MSRWLTAKRLRAHGLLLALTLWLVYFWILATPGLRDRNGNLKGTDFLHFYTIGTLARQHRGAELYDMSAQAALAARRVPEAAGIRYLPLYPPQVSLLFAPFASLSYGQALIAWWILNVLIYGACCFAIWKVCPNLQSSGGIVALAAIAFPGFFNLIAWGQTSGLALGCFTLLFFMLRDRRDFLAGLILGLLIFKPQLGVAAAVLFLALGRWKVVLGAVISAAAELSVGTLYYGWQPLRSWIRVLGNVRNVSLMLEPRPYQTHSLRTFWSMLIPWEPASLALYLISAAVVLGWTIVVWRRSDIWRLRYSLLLLATVLVSPHLTVYDLVILAPGFLLLADWLMGQPRSGFNGLIGTTFYLAYVLPLLVPIARWTHIQFSVLAMTLLVYLVWKEVRSTTSHVESLHASPIRVN